MRVERPERVKRKNQNGLDKKRKNKKSCRELKERTENRGKEAVASTFDRIHSGFFQNFDPGAENCNLTTEVNEKPI